MKETIIQLEKSLYLPENRFNPNFLNNILHPNFTEESPLGIFTKQMILNQLIKKDTTYEFINDINANLNQNFITIEYSIKKKIA